MEYWRTKRTPEQLRQYDALSAAYARVREDRRWRRLRRAEQRAISALVRFPQRYDLPYQKLVQHMHAEHRLRVVWKAAEKARKDYESEFKRRVWERTLAESNMAL